MKRLIDVLLGSLTVCALACVSTVSAHPSRSTQYIPRNPPLKSLNISKKNAWFVGVGGGLDGLSFSDKTNSLLNNVLSNPNDTFTLDNTTQNEGSIHALAGSQWRFGTAHKKRVNLAVEYDYFTNASVKGKRTPPGSATTTYSFKVSRQALLLLAKVDFMQWGRHLMPYFQLGVGVSRNKFFNFNEPNPSVTMPDFSQ